MGTSREAATRFSSASSPPPPPPPPPCPPAQSVDVLRVIVPTDEGPFNVVDWEFSGDMYLGNDTITGLKIVIGGTPTNPNAGSAVQNGSTAIRLTYGDESLDLRGLTWFTPDEQGVVDGLWCPNSLSLDETGTVEGI